MRRTITTFVRAHFTVLILPLITSVSAWLALQGWAGRITSVDLIPHARDAALLLNNGAIPSHGCLSSLGSYIPPGASWLLVPGQWLFSDPRLETVPAALALHFATVTGVYCLAAWCWTRTAGVWAALLFAFSPMALQLASNTWWHRFPMAATVWFAFFAVRWVWDRKPRWLAAAVLVLMLGLYVHMEGLPLAMVLPLLWLIWRPPVFSRAMLVALGIGLLVWSPYLRFEHGRHYADLKSQVGLQSLLYAPPALERLNALLAHYGLPVVEPPKTATPLSYKACVLDATSTLALHMTRVPRSISSNLTFYGLGEKATLAVSLLLLLFLAANGLPALRRWHKEMDELADRLSAPRVWTALGILAWLAAVGLNERLLVWLLCVDGHIEDCTQNSILFGQATMALTGTVLLLRRSVLAALRRGLLRAPCRATPLVFVLLPVWLLLAWMSSDSTPYRAWLLWPLQIACLVGMILTASEACTRQLTQGSPGGSPSATSSVPLFGGIGGRFFPRLTRLATLSSLAVLTVTSPPFLDRIQAWHREGWRGESDEVKALQFLARTIKAEGRPTTAIGYVTPFSPFMLHFRVLDPGYKVGGTYDWYLGSGYAITNTDLDPSGLSAHDVYRLVAARRPVGLEVGPLPAPKDGWRPIRRYGLYTVLKNGSEIP